MSRRQLLIASALILAGCATPTADPGTKRREIDAKVDNALAQLYAVNGARQLAERAAGVLVIPDVVSAGFIVGGTYGQGALRKHNVTSAYYSVGAGSVGLLAGVQSKTMYLLFMTPDALGKFEQSDGWTIGADASVAFISVGAEGRLDTETGQASVVGLVRDQAGFMASLSLDGTKFNRLAL